MSQVLNVDRPSANNDTDRYRYPRLGDVLLVVAIHTTAWDSSFLIEIRKQGLDTFR